VSDRDQAAGRLAEEDLVLREVVEEPILVFRVAVQQKGGPALFGQPAHLLRELGVPPEGRHLKRHFVATSAVCVLVCRLGRRSKLRGNL